MCPEYPVQNLPLRRRQQGAGLPMAIFLITVMALIVTTITQLQQSGGESDALDILSTRAFYSAESGAQLALVEVLEDEAASCHSPASYEFSRGLSGCSASVVCENLTSASGDALMQITSTGECGSGADRTIRRIEVRVQ